MIFVCFVSNDRGFNFVVLNGIFYEFDISLKVHDLFNVELRDCLELVQNETDIPRLIDKS